MKAAVLTELRAPLEVRQVADPVVEPGGAVVRVEACGICRSDWHVWQGDLSWLGFQPQLPLVQGHEIGGIVEAVGAGVRGFAPGDRVTVPFHLACGHCTYCQSGRSNLCLAYGAIGMSRDGGFGQFATVPNADMNLVRLPEGVDPLVAAALGCRYMTAYHGLVDQAGLRPGEWVAVFGLGGLGLSAVQIAAALGAQVVAVSHSQDKLEHARAEGAAAIVQADVSDVAGAVREVSGGGVDVAVDALGATATTLPGLFPLKKGGQHLQLGLTGQQEQGMIALPVDAIVLQELRFLGSQGCPVTSYPGLLALVASGRLAPQRLVGRTLCLEEVNEVSTGMSDYAPRGFNVITAW